MLNIINGIIIFLFGNIDILSNSYNIDLSAILLLIMFVIINIFPGLFRKKLETQMLEKCRNGNNLLISFLISVILTCALYIVSFIFQAFKSDLKTFIIDVVFAVFVEAIVFWNGIVRVYLSSKQLGIKWRILGAALGMIPILNLWCLFNIIKITGKEVKFENDKLLLNKKRENEKICETKYPILLVHGVFFRDSKYFDYWGRIPKELEKNGATIFYGNHQSAASVENSAKELKARVEEILKQTGKEKVNIIAHSKGGLDSRYMISVLGMDDKVASLTTVNTPNRGCEFAEYILSKVSDNFVKIVANNYNTILKKFGDENPDFISAVTDLTYSGCKRLNEIINDSDKVYYQSIGSKLNIAKSGRFPLNLTYRFVKNFDGPNDGLVGEESFKLGDNYEFLTVTGKRGLSHGDVIDLNRENIDEFDVREYYVQLVSKLKEKGF